MPFKAQVLDRCTRLTPSARSIGAVNTLVATGDGWTGHNTDADAARDAVATAIDPVGRTVVLLGAGGAARAAAVALADAGAEIVVLNRHRARAEEVAALVGGTSGGLEDLGGVRADVLVNATPVGMADDRSTPVPTDGLSGSEVVLDMVYRPQWTEFLRVARSRGCRVVSGLEMFVRQASAQYRLWTDAEPPAGALERAALAELEDDASR
jgi:shikimate dehydrogenase